MWKSLIVILETLRSSVRSQQKLSLENLELRRQLAKLIYRSSRHDLADSEFEPISSNTSGYSTAAIDDTDLLSRCHRLEYE